MKIVIFFLIVFVYGYNFTIKEPCIFYIVKKCSYSSMYYKDFIYNITNKLDNYTSNSVNLNNITKICDKYNITENDIPIYVLDAEYSSETYFSLGIVTNHTYNAFKNSKSMSELCSNTFNNKYTNLFCTFYNVIDAFTPVISLMNGFSNSTYRNYSYVNTYMNYSDIIQTANALEKSDYPNEVQKNMSETYKSFVMLNELIFDFQNHPHGYENPIFNLVKDPHKYIKNTKDIINKNMENYYSSYYHNNNILTISYRLYKRLEHQLSNKIQDLKYNLYYIYEHSHEHSFSFRLKKALEHYYEDIKSGHYYKNNVKLIDYLVDENKKSKKKHEYNYRKLKIRSNRYKNRHSNLFYNEKMHDWNHEFFDYDSNFIHLKDYELRTLKKWSGFKDNTFDICSVSDIINGTVCLFSWLFHINKCNETGLNLGFPRPPNSDSGAIYPEIVCNSNFSIKSFLFPEGFDISNPGCSYYSNLSNWLMGLVYLFFTPIYGYNAYLHPNSFYSKIVYNATGKQGLEALPPNLRVCLVVNAFWGTIGLFVVFIAIVLLSIAFNFIGVFRKAIEKANDELVVDDGGFVRS